MPIKTNQYKELLRKTGIPLTELNRNTGERPQAKKPQWIPADQVANVQLLTDILNELQEIKKVLQSK